MSDPLIPLNLLPPKPGFYVLRSHAITGVPGPGFPAPYVARPIDSYRWFGTIRSSWSGFNALNGNEVRYAFPHDTAHFPERLRLPARGSAPRGYRIPFWWETFDPEEEIFFMLWDRETRTYKKHRGPVPITQISLTEVRVRVDHVPWTWTRRFERRAIGQTSEGRWVFSHGPIPKCDQITLDYLGVKNPEGFYICP